MLGDGLVFRRAVPQPERNLDPIGAHAEADDAAAALQLDPVEQQRRQPNVAQRAAHQRTQVLARAAHELTRDAGLRRRALRGEHLVADRLAGPGEPACRDAGEHLLEHDARERVAVGEVRVGPKRHLVPAVSRPRARTLHADATATQGDLAGLVAVAHRCAVGVALALRAHDPGDLGLEHLGQHTEPDADAQRKQPVLRGVDQLAQRVLHARRQRQLAGVAVVLYVLHGGPFVSVDLFALATLPHGSRRGGGTATYEVLRATGQPDHSRWSELYPHVHRREPRGGRPMTPRRITDRFGQIEQRRGAPEPGFFRSRGSAGGWWGARGLAGRVGGRGGHAASAHARAGRSGASRARGGCR